MQHKEQKVQRSTVKPIPKKMSTPHHYLVVEEHSYSTDDNALSKVLVHQCRNIQTLDNIHKNEEIQLPMEQAEAGELIFHLFNTLKNWLNLPQCHTVCTYDPLSKTHDRVPPVVQDLWTKK